MGPSRLREDAKGSPGYPWALLGSWGSGIRSEPIITSLALWQCQHGLARLTICCARLYFCCKRAQVECSRELENTWMASDAFGRLRAAFGRLRTLSDCFGRLSDGLILLINAAMYFPKAQADSLLQATPLATPPPRAAQAAHQKTLLLLDSSFSRCQARHRPRFFTLLLRRRCHRRSLQSIGSKAASFFGSNCFAAETARCRYLPTLSRRSFSIPTTCFSWTKAKNMRSKRFCNQSS